VTAVPCAGVELGGTKCVCSLARSPDDILDRRVVPTAGPEDASRIAQKLLRTLREPFEVEQCSVDVGASIGIAVGPTHGSDAVTLLRHAEVAMYIAKQARSGSVVYSPEQDEYSADRLKLIGELRQAIGQEGLTLYYQPKVSVQTGQVTGVEALVRWEHPQRGLIPPDQFIALAEHAGLIRPLTRWVLQAALRQCRAWLDAGREIPVAVNVSAHDLHDASFPDTVAGLLASTVAACRPAGPR
jgi:predicted signal transduction protein with EAL and GGDEF domain